MSQILVVESSPRGSDSASRKLAAELVEELHKKLPQAKIVRRDVAASPLPHLSSDVVAAAYTPIEQRTPALKSAIALSDQIVDELLASDTLVIATPMWNFSVPSSLKAWIDHIIRAGRTFSFTAQGPEGLVKGKRAYLVVATGGVYSEGPYSQYDFLVPYLKGVLGFIGVTDVRVVRAEGLNDPKHVDQALAKARASLKNII